VRYANGHQAACHHPRNVDAAEVAAAEVSEHCPDSADQSALPFVDSAV
jgi:hypothetical protein